MESNELVMPETPATQDKLLEIGRIAQRMIDKQRYVEKLEEALEKAKLEHKIISEQELPQAMGEIKMFAFRLSTGFRITLKPVFVVNYIKDKINDVEEWLDENNYSGMVKNVITVSIPKGASEEQIYRLEEAISNYQWEHERKKTINYQTLNAWGREMEREERIIPDDLFNVYRATKAIAE